MTDVLTAEASMNDMLLSELTHSRQAELGRNASHRDQIQNRTSNETTSATPKTPWI
jgi:hypothetical protein